METNEKTIKINYEKNIKALRKTIKEGEAVLKQYQKNYDESELDIDLGMITIQSNYLIGLDVALDIILEGE